MLECNEAKGTVFGTVSSYCSWASRECVPHTVSGRAGADNPNVVTPVSLHVPHTDHLRTSELGGILLHTEAHPETGVRSW